MSQEQPKAHPVSIEVFEIDARGNRQIGPRLSATAFLAERRDDIADAVSEAVDAIQAAGASIKDSQGWHVSSLQATFGISLLTEAGVIISKASAQASLEVTVTIARDSHQV